MRPWEHIRIEECGEPLVALEPGLISLESPHPYVALGAPYGDFGPWYLRATVKARLLDAQARLTTERAGWKLHLLDAWRPLSVQAFMVEHTDALLRREAPELDDAARRERVLTYWAPPSEDPKRPPPHSTGAAIDLTLTDETGRVVNMGSPFDEPTERSWPEHFEHATDAHGREAHANRTLLARVMLGADFVRHPQEWWHFSYGDRAWAREHDREVAQFGRTSP